ncbi:MAG: dienelactone hydrolase family protein [Bacteroidetes bacterium]|nr:dienelactone hydrolase family protein [Bacteroidota bacterium]
MKNISFYLIGLLFVLVSCKNQDKDKTIENEDIHAHHVMAEESDNLFLQKLNSSPRHHEWVTLEVGGRELYNFVVYPEKSGDTPAVILIHENRGLNDWARSFADELAAEGFLVIAPDLLSNAVPGVPKTTDFSSTDAAREALYGLKPDQITEDLNAVFEYIKKAPSSNCKVSVIGFCWGGSQSFRYATNNPNLEKSFVFYGTAPQEATDIKKIQIPVYGFYGGNDNRVNATIDPTKAIMDEAGLTYEYVIYPGAGHAFMRSGASADGSPENKNAYQQAKKRLIELLNQ